MYYLEKNITISSSHKLDLDYDSKCSDLHGHNWDITIYCKSDKLDKNGMIVDFALISKIVKELDHVNLNDVLDFNPTCENLCKYLSDKIPFCYKVKIKETDKSTCIYEQI